MYLCNKKEVWEMLIDVMGNMTCNEIETMMGKVLVKIENIHAVDEDLLWGCINETEIGKRFIEAHRLTNLYELIDYHHERKMKYDWGVYRNISGNVDCDYDSLESNDYLD